MRGWENEQLSKVDWTRPVGRVRIFHTRYITRAVRTFLYFLTGWNPKTTVEQLQKMRHRRTDVSSSVCASSLWHGAIGIVYAGSRIVRNVPSSCLFQRKGRIADDECPHSRYGCGSIVLVLVLYMHPAAFLWNQLHRVFR